MEAAQLKQKSSGLIESLVLGIFTIVLWLGFSGYARSPVPTSTNSVQAQEPKVFNPQSQPKVFNPGAENSAPAAKRHKISLNVVSLEDLKITDGDMIAAGDLISDRTEQRIALESQIARIESAIKQSEQAIAPMPALPAPDYSQELAELDRAQGMAKYWENLSMPQSRFKGELATLDYATINRQHELEAEKLRAQLAVEQAIARLEAAQASYESLKYKHQLERSDWEANRQRQEYQIGQLQQQLADLQDKLSRLSVVRSPVSGTVRRVRILGQSDRNISVEVIIDAENS